MKLHTKLLAAALLLGGAQAAFAADLGTNAGQTINNTASVSFSVGGVPQTAPADGVAEFVVDRKVDVIVDATSGATVAPGSSDQVLAFDVTNKTNDTLDFLLSTESLTGDDFNASGLTIWVDTNGNGTLDTTDPDGGGPLTADTQANYIDGLAEDATIKVFVQGDIPSTPTVADGDTSDVALVAQAADPTGSVGSPGSALAESGAADDPNTVENVFADAAGTATGDVAEDGKHSDTATYTVGAASVSVTKTYKVIYEDAANTANFSPAGQLKPIPGALVEYCILVSNTGGTAATDVAISDPIDTTHLTWVVDSIKVDTDCSDYAGATDSEDDDTTDEDPDGGGPLLGDETDGVSGSYNSGTGTVSTDVDSLSGSSTTATMFRVIVK